MSRIEPQAGGQDAHAAQIPHFSRRGYLIGFALALILTAIPFWLVMGRVLPSPATTAYVILAFAIVQIVVHMVFFLHMNTKSEGGWNFLALIFTVIMLLIVVGGSLWVMHHLNVNMMPPMTPQEILHGP